MASSAQLSQLPQQAERSVGEAAGSVLHGVREAAGDAAHKTEEGLDYLKDKASDYLEQGKKGMKALGRTMEAQIQERPVSTLLLAAGIGAFVAAVAVISLRR